jgi:hypothetical protein
VQILLSFALGKPEEEHWQKHAEDSFFFAVYFFSYPAYGSFLETHTMKLQWRIVADVLLKGDGGARAWHPHHSNTAHNSNHCSQFKPPLSHRTSTHNDSRQQQQHR